jgi:hypothetical protein
MQLFGSKNSAAPAIGNHFELQKGGPVRSALRAWCLVLLFVMILLLPAKNKQILPSLPLIRLHQE